jgi:cellobiose-specific phosphotransferase system component IIB
MISIHPKYSHKKIWIKSKNLISKKNSNKFSMILVAPIFKMLSKKISSIKFILNKNHFKIQIMLMIKFSKFKMILKDLKNNFIKEKVLDSMCSALKK